MEQLNSEQLLSFVEVPPLVAAAAAEHLQQQQQQSVGEHAGGGSGGSSPSMRVVAGDPEFSRLHNGSLVQTLVREAVLTLADRALM
jgi:hypothetical protein